MDAIINNCTLCGSHKYEILFPSFYQGKLSKFEKVVICKDCGLIYKNPIIPNDESTHYMDVKHWVSPYYNEKFLESAKYVAGILKLTADSKVLDIGAAAGHFLHNLKKVTNVKNLFGIEPARDICINAMSSDMDLNMIPYTLETTQLPDRYFDLITAFGVDYLFFDHNKMLRKISDALNSFGGVFYVERNVFLEMPAFVTKRVKYLDDLFGTNSMLKNWFTEKQFERQLMKYFNIAEKNVFYSERIKGLKVKQIGYVCHNSATDSYAPFDNDYEHNKQFVLSMPRKIKF